MILQLINNTGNDVPLADVGIVIPPSGDTFNDPEFLRVLCQSENLRSALNSEDLTANDGVNNMTAAQAIVYLSLIWTQGGRTDVSGMRTIASGQTTIAALATVTLATVSRMPTERLLPALFVTDNVNGAAFSEGLALLGNDSVRIYFERTNSANEFLVKASSSHSTQSRTIDWAVLGVRV